MSPSSPRLLVVDPDPAAAAELCSLLVVAGFDVLPPAADAASALDLAERARPALALVDASIEREADGVALAADLGRRLGLRIVLLSSRTDRATLERAASLPVNGFVVKPFQGNQLVATVSAALGQPALLHLPPPGARGEGPVPLPDVPGMDRLTAREREVLQGLLAARRIRGIAATMKLSQHTVRNYVKSILYKLSVHSQDELVALLSSTPATATHGTPVAARAAG